jgi:hypothetical protein
LNTLRLLESLSPDKVASGKIENVIPLLQRFGTLTPDTDSAYDELNSISLFYKPNDVQNVDAVSFWLDIYDKKDAAGNGRFKNIALFALNLLCLPFSNASVERVFSAMALVKTKLRNRLLCETVDLVLAVRYGLKLLGTTPARFEAPGSMLKLFNADIYEKRDEEEELQFNDVYEALAALENM